MTAILIRGHRCRRHPRIVLAEFASGGESCRSGPSAARSGRQRRRSGEGAGKGVGTGWRRCHPAGGEGYPMQRHRRQCRRVNDRKRRCGGEIDPQPARGTPAGMRVPGGPIGAIRICQARVMIMIRFQQRFQAADTRPRGKSIWQEDLEEQCGDRYPGRDFASDSIAHPRLVPPAVAMRARHLRYYHRFRQRFRWHVDARATLNPGIIGRGDQSGRGETRALRESFGSTGFGSARGDTRWRERGSPGGRRCTAPWG
jgi:hypothetical protein